MNRSATSEADLASVVVAWLEACGYDVYQEVELRPGGIRADIVARRGPELTIVETKTSASLAVLYQAMERRGCAHRVYVGVPRSAIAFRELCTEIGIGVLHVRTGSNETWDAPRVDEEVSSRRWNTRPLKLAGRLRPEHKTAAAAGSQTGGHWSRWRDTCAQIARIAAQHPGIALKAAIAQVTHHYSSSRVAVSTMAGHIREGRVEGIKLEGGALWPIENTGYVPGDQR